MFSIVHSQEGQTHSIAQADIKSKGLSLAASPKQRSAAPMVAPHISFSQQCDPRIQSSVYQSWP